MAGIGLMKCFLRFRKWVHEHPSSSRVVSIVFWIVALDCVFQEAVFYYIWPNPIFALLTIPALVAIVGAVVFSS